MATKKKATKKKATKKLTLLEKNRLAWAKEDAWKDAIILAK